MNSGELLERSLAYALGCVAGVLPGSLGRATPCARWDLEELLRHLDDSVDVLHEGVAGGRVGLCPSPSPADPVCAFRQRARALLGAWAVASGELLSPRPSVGVGDRSLDLWLLAAVGAVEIAVHGWDVAQACGRPRPIPSALAAELLPIARCFVAEADRGVRFAEPVDEPSTAWHRPEDRLLAFLGRRPSPPDFPCGPGVVRLP